MKTLLLAVLFSCLVCSAINCSSVDGDRADTASKDEKSVTKIEEKREVSLDPKEWMTKAESTDFKVTSDYRKTMAFLRRLEKQLPEMKLTSFGYSAEGRELPLVVLGDFDHTPSGA